MHYGYFIFRAEGNLLWINLDKVKSGNIFISQRNRDFDKTFQLKMLHYGNALLYPLFFDKSQYENSLMIRLRDDEVRCLFWVKVRRNFNQNFPNRLYIGLFRLFLFLYLGGTRLGFILKVIQIIFLCFLNFATQKYYFLSIPTLNACVMLLISVILLDGWVICINRQQVLNEYYIVSLQKLVLQC